MNPRHRLKMIKRFFEVEKSRIKWGLILNPRDSLTRKVRM